LYFSPIPYVLFFFSLAMLLILKTKGVVKVRKGILVCFTCKKVIEGPRNPNRKHHFCTRSCHYFYRRSINDKLKNDIRRLYESGNSITEVNKMLNIKNTKYYVKTLGISRTLSDARLLWYKKHLRLVKGDNAHVH
jgi:hypothetical protein